MKLNKCLKVSRYLLAFILPIFLLAVAYYLNGIYWGSTRSILASDSFTQTINFYDSFHDVLHGKANFFYNWNAAFGLNYLGLYSYYLGGPLTFLVYFFGKAQMVDAVYLLILLKFGLMGLSGYWFAKRTFNLADWQQHILALCYSLLAFGVAYAEQPMWLDTLYILPLVIAGVNDLIATQRRRLLFVAYVLLFLTNFYLAYMVGIFSLLYYLLISWAQRKITWKNAGNYFWTVICSLLTASWLLLPVVSFLRRTHEPLSKLTGFFTDNAGLWDLIIKNMVGVYDTTKFGTVPFVYVGILPLLLAIYFFVRANISLREKISYALLLASIALGFYLQIFNLLWQGWHFPSMFLYRYSFLWSFLIFLLAGKAWEKVKTDSRLIKIGSAWVIITVLGYLGSFGHYHYAGNTNFIITLALVIIYSFLLSRPSGNYELGKRILLGLLVICELTFNAFSLLHGTSNEWHYPDRKLYTQNYSEITADLKPYRQSATPLRAANLDEGSQNDGLNYGYSTADLFSSMRNRPFEAQMNHLGFKSGGNNLNFAYANNTLIMDSLMAIKLNLARGSINKYGFSHRTSAGENFHVYQNKLAPGVAILTDANLQRLHLTDNVLKNQSQLLNAVSSLPANTKYFTSTTPQLTLVSNSQVTKDKHHFYLNTSSDNALQTLTWKVKIPAGRQAYFDLSLLAGQGNSCNVVLNVPQRNLLRQVDLNMSGQFFDLGYYSHARTITFTTKIYGSHQLTFDLPKVVFLSTHKYRQATDRMKARTVKLKYQKNQVKGTVKTTHRWLYTSIPFDPGWHAKINQHAIKVQTTDGLFVALPLKKGINRIQLKFIPQGFYLGIVLTAAGLVLFAFGELDVIGRWTRKHHICENNTNCK